MPEGQKKMEKGAEGQKRGRKQKKMEKGVEGKKKGRRQKKMEKGAAANQLPPAPLSQEKQPPPAPQENQLPLAPPQQERLRGVRWHTVSCVVLICRCKKEIVVKATPETQISVSCPCGAAPRLVIQPDGGLFFQSDASMDNHDTL